MHNPVDLDAFLLPKIERKEDPFTFLTVAFLKKIKGIDILIRAFYEAFSNQDNIKLKIGGDGVEKERLMNLVDSLNLNNQVEFLGQLSRSEVSYEMQNNNIFVLPSRFETFGVVLIEALASGMPVISTKCGGPEDIVSKEVGELVKTDDVQQLRKALEYMYLNYYKYNPIKLSNYCKDNFGKEYITNKLLSIYREII